MLPEVWKAKIPFRVKVHSTFHLTCNIVFPFIVLASILNVPLTFIKHEGGYDAYFNFMSIFVLAFFGSFLFYLYSQKDIYPDWQRRIFLFPLFMAGSMGFAVNNSKAVLEGLFKRKSEFIRTPKYGIKEKSSSWADKIYVPVKFSWTVIIEIALALYCGFGTLASLYYLELAAIPFQLLFTLGYGFVAWMSIQQALEARRIKTAKAKLHMAPIAA